MPKVHLSAGLFSFLEPQYVRRPCHPEVAPLQGEDFGSGRLPMNRKAGFQFVKHVVPLGRQVGPVKEWFTRNVSSVVTTFDVAL